jgi:hypothetical protein
MRTDALRAIARVNASTVSRAVADFKKRGWAEMEWAGQSSRHVWLTSLGKHEAETLIREAFASHQGLPAERTQLRAFADMN